MTKRELFGKCLKALVTLEYQNDPRWESTIGCNSISNVDLQYYMNEYISDEIIETGDPEDYVDDFWEWITPSEK